MNRFLYSTLFYLATPLLILRLLYRSLRAPAYLRRWPERFAFYSSKKDIPKADVVFHAVSVGEVHAAVPLIKRLLTDQPSLKILLTTSTPTGSARVTQLLSEQVAHVYLPYDLPGAVQRFLETFDPRVLVIMETELWPNLIHRCANKGIKVLLANARLSEKSMYNYEKISSLARVMLGELDKVTAQSPQDGQRLEQLGLAHNKTIIAGSMKYDMAINTAQVDQAREDKSGFNGRPVLIAASTRLADGEAEEAKILQAFQLLLKTTPDLLLLLVPRHPERFSAVYEMAVKQGLLVARRTREGIADASHQVFLGDSMGEMHYYFGLADIAFVGGSLVPTGCQNIIEPAALGLPVISGPSLFNFQQASEQLQQAGALIKVEDEAELAKVVQELLENSDKRTGMGKAGLAAVEASQGATTKNLAVISELLASTS